MKTAEEILKSKLDLKIIILNNPDYTFNKVIEAMEEYANQGKWISVDAKNLPKEEVLAYGYEDEILIGYLEANEEGHVSCESENELLMDVTHYQELPYKPTK